MIREKPRSRRKPSRNPAKIIFIICEGVETEPNYFMAINRRFRETLKDKYVIKIPVTIHTDAIGLVSEALECLENCEPSDEVWCVFDVDDNQDNALKEAMLMAQDKINIAISNPCFEVWYFLHFFYSTAQYTSDTMKQRLKNNYIPNYSESMQVLEILCKNPSASLHDAIERAKKLNHYHENAGNDINLRSGNPSTHIYKIFQRLEIDQY